tara:strand:+ start:11322 stop:12230 length:909 start_codon:yes stop_codon:yes gene_type:complete
MQNRISVFGSINMDLVIYSNASPSEGETIFGNSFETFLGGKGANQAIAAARMGSEVSFVGKVGSDLFGKKLKEKLESENIDTELLQEHAGESGVAFINVIESTSQNQITVVSGANTHAQSDQLSDEVLSSSEIILSQLEMPLQEIEKLFLRASSDGCLRILNVAPALQLSETLFNETDIFLVNELELSALSEKPLLINDINSIKECIDSLQLHDDQSIVVTLGSQGVYVHQQGKNEFFLGHEVNAVDTTGSGDCFIGAMASHMLLNKNLFEASEFANKAAALSVTKKGASISMPSRQEVLDF